MDKLWFKPTESMKIIDPHMRTICPPEGKWVGLHDEYYHRRTLDGGGAYVEPPENAHE